MDLLSCPFVVTNFEVVVLFEKNPCDTVACQASGLFPGESHSFPGGDQRTEVSSSAIFFWSSSSIPMNQRHEIILFVMTKEVTAQQKSVSVAAATSRTSQSESNRNKLRGHGDLGTHATETRTSDSSN